MGKLKMSFILSLKFIDYHAYLLFNSLNITKFFPKAVKKIFQGVEESADSAHSFAVSEQSVMVLY